MLNDGSKIQIEIADTEARRRLGLMHRTYLAANSGMLFIHPSPSILGVWMKNTLIPLDILFLSDDGTIVSMLEDLPPCRQDPCPISRSSTKARYMLEVNAGVIAQHRLETGQRLTLGLPNVSEE